MFYFRYHRLSIGCPVFGAVRVQLLSRACPEIEHPYPAPLKRVMGGDVQDISPMAELLDAAMVGGFGSDLGAEHHFPAVNVELFPEKLVVPQLEQAHVQTDMGRVQSTILKEQFQYPVKVFDIIDGVGSAHREAWLTVCASKSSMICAWS